MVDILLVRHGETRWNREEIFRGRSDIPLNEFGRRQAEALGKSLLKWNLKEPLFISGPLSRAYETAYIAASAFNREENIIKEDGFNDIRFGEWEGKTLAQVEENYSELYALWKKTPGKVNFPGGENLDTVADRAEKTIYRLARGNPERSKIIVSHRAVIKALLCRLLGLGSDSFWKLGQGTACINELKFTGSEFILIKLNDTCHLQLLGEDIKDF